MLVYFVRHGESVANVNSLHHTPDIPLTENGIKQAVVVAKRLKNMDADFIYSSPMTRAKQTAEIISKEKGLPIEYWESLKEITIPSIVRGKPLNDKDVIKIDKEYSNIFLKGKRYLDEETFEELSLRGQSILKHLLEHHKNQNVICVSHSTMIKMIVARIIIGDKLTPHLFVHLRDRMHTKNTGITVCEFSKKHGWVLNTWNDTTHL